MKIEPRAKAFIEAVGATTAKRLLQWLYLMDDQDFVLMCKETGQRLWCAKVYSGAALPRELSDKDVVSIKVLVRRLIGTGEFSPASVDGLAFEQFMGVSMWSWSDIDDDDKSEVLRQSIEATRKAGYLLLNEQERERRNELNELILRLATMQGVEPVSGVSATPIWLVNKMIDRVAEEGGR